MMMMWRFVPSCTCHRFWVPYTGLQINLLLCLFSSIPAKLAAAANNCNPSCKKRSPRQILIFTRHCRLRVCFFKAIQIPPATRNPSLSKCLHLSFFFFFPETMTTWNLFSEGANSNFTPWKRLRLKSAIKRRETGMGRSQFRIYTLLQKLPMLHLHRPGISSELQNEAISMALLMVRIGTKASISSKWVKKLVMSKIALLID